MVLVTNINNIINVYFINYLPAHVQDLSDLAFDAADHALGDELQLGSLWIERPGSLQSWWSQLFCILHVQSMLISEPPSYSCST